MADVIIINKVQTADRQDILTVRDNVKRINPDAVIIEAASPIIVDKPEEIRGKRVLVVEDGPTVTHGGMTYGAGMIAAEDNGAAEIVDPRPFAVGSIAAIFNEYKHIGRLLPAMGYGKEQIAELEETINRSDCDVVVSGTPVDLKRVIRTSKPIIRVTYELCEIGRPTLDELIINKLGTKLRMTQGPL
jgi:predicted GTPase